MKLGGQGLQVVGGAEILVDSIDVLDPVSVIAFSICCGIIDVLDNWRDPDLPTTISSRSNVNSSKTVQTHGGESHALDVIQLVDNSLPCSSTVQLHSCIASGGSRAICARKTVGDQLINGSASPVFVAGAGHGLNECGDEQTNSEKESRRFRRGSGNCGHPHYRRSARILGVNFEV